MEQPSSTTRRGRVGHQIAQTLNTTPTQAVVEIRRVNNAGEETVSHILEEDGTIKDRATKLGNIYDDRFDGGGDFGGNVLDKNGLSPTLKTSAAASKQFVYENEEILRIRKMTPKEYFRLQAFDDSDFDACVKAGLSNTQLYKQAGNSITCSVPYYLIGNLFKANIFREDKKEMEFKVEEYTLPQVIKFNFEEIKAELAAKVEMYKGLVYTDEQITDAKKDRANLNALKKALNDERIRREKEYMIPFNAFKEQVAEIVALIDEPAKMIDLQVKDYEEKKKLEKKKEIEEMYASFSKPDWMSGVLPIMWKDSWTNASTSIKSIETEIKAKIDTCVNEMASILMLPAHSFEAREMYKSTLDVTKALNEAHRLSELDAKRVEEEAKRNAEEEVIPVAPVVTQVEAQKAVEKTYEVSFKAIMTVPQAKALKAFFENNNIKYETIK